MKKSDLKSGMVVKFREYDKLYILIGDTFCSYDGAGFMKLNKYDNELCYMLGENVWDIVEVYKCKWPNLMSCFIENGLELIWKRKEIDWSKVPIGTKVRVWDDYDTYIEGEGLFLEYVKDDSNYPFRAYVKDNDFNYWSNCELIEEPKEEKEVTYDEIEKAFIGICDKGRCISCKYDEYEHCKFGYILENYNVTRKDI